MKNKVMKKVLAGSMLLAFTLTNCSLPVLAYGISDYIEDSANGILLAEDMSGIRGFNSSSVARDVFSGASYESGDVHKPTETIKLRGDISLTDKNIPVTLSLRDSDVSQVIRMFADKAGLNVIFAQDVSGSVTMDLVDYPINDAFDLIMEMNQLFYLVDNNTLIVYSEPGGSTINMKEMIAIPVKYIDAMPMASFLNQNIFGLKKPGLSGSYVATTNPRKNEILIFGTKSDAEMAKRVVEQFDTKPVFRTYKVNHVTPDVMAEMICTQLLPTIIDIDSAKKGDIGQITGAASGEKGLSIGGGQIACGYTSDMKTSSRGGGGSVDFASLPLLALEVSYSQGLGTINVMGATDAQFGMIEDFIKKNDIKEPQAYLEISIIELNEAGSRTFDNTWRFVSKNLKVSFTGETGTGTGNNNPIYIIDHNNNKVNDFATQNNGAYPAMSLSWTINYIVENRKGRIVANPRILVTNGKEATIDLTSDYVKTVTSQIVQGVNNATSQKDYEIGDDNGIKVTLTPFISPDGYVTLDINPDYATISGREYTYNDDNEQELAATLLQRRNLELKGVRIKDGETLIIGGMIRDEETKNIAKIPFLGDIPYIGAIFRSTNTEKTKEEMIIMITPKIITDNEDAISEQDTL